jgi:FkbM family methyltransferase
MTHMRSRAVKMARRALEHFDVSLGRLCRTAPARRARLIADADINVLIDVGAHVGAYAVEARRFGYRGRIESFEALARPYKALAERASRDPLWRCHNVALGDTNGTLTMHVAGNEVSSSALEMLPRHVEGAPDSRYVRTESSRAGRLDDFDVASPVDRLYLKVDVQGFEKRVRAGATETLGSVSLLEAELSLVQLYQDGPLWIPMIEYLAGLGFEPIWLDPGFYDNQTGRLLQIDAIFAKS